MNRKGLGSPIFITRGGSHEYEFNQLAGGRYDEWVRLVSPKLFDPPGGKELASLLS